MKNIILKSLLWVVIAWIGSMAIFIFWGEDLANLKENIGIWVFGAFMGVMSTYLGKILPERIKEGNNKLYEIETNMKVDVSNSEPFIVYVKIHLYDKVFLKHALDYFEKKKDGLDNLYIIVDTSLYFTAHIINSYYMGKRSHIDLSKAINEGSSIAFQKEKHAIKFIKSLDRLVDRLFKHPRKTYIDALKYRKEELT